MNMTANFTPTKQTKINKSFISINENKTDRKSSQRVLQQTRRKARTNKNFIKYAD